MITAGVDVGNMFTKALLQEGGRVLSYAILASGLDRKRAARETFRQALIKAGVTEDDVSNVFSTGAGQDEVDFATGTVTDITAAARGTLKIFPMARIVADVGAEGAKVLKTDDDGRVLGFTINEKCAAGTGSFLETMGRALGVQLEELGPLSLEAERAVTINAQCAVFAESEVVSLIHAKVPREVIARSIHEAMAGRVSSMVRRVGLQKKLALIGGVARNKGFAAALEKDLDAKLLIDDEKPEFLCALGAALLAAERDAGQLP